MSIEYAQGWDDAKAQVTTDNSQTLVNALAEIERLNELCKEYRENGDRLMRVSDEYKAMVERLKAIHEVNADTLNAMQAEIEQRDAVIDRKDAALRVARDALEETVNVPCYGGHPKQEAAISVIKEALAEPSEPVAEVAGDYNTKHIIFLPAGIALEVGDKLFTHPAKPEPLTDEAISKMYIEHSAYQEEGPETSGWYDFARAVEAAILEKLK